MIEESSLEDNLLRKLKSVVEEDLEPVQPLAAPGLRALWWLGISLILGIFSLTIFGARPDLQALGSLKSAGFSLLQVVLCILLFRFGLRASIPGMTGSNVLAAFWVGLVFLVHLALNWSTLKSTALYPPEGSEWTAGLACLTIITALSLLPLAVAGLFLTRGLVTHLLPIVALIGVGSGLLAESAWRLHCGYSSWGHILPFHSGAAFLSVLIALNSAVFLLRKD